MPHLDKLKSKSTFQDLEIIPINIADEELVKSKEFFEEINIKNLEIFYGSSIGLAKEFKLRGIPTTIFVDKENNTLSSLCDDICEKAFQKGLLVVHTGRESIKIGPPLTISNEALIEGLEVLEESIKENIYDD